MLLIDFTFFGRNKVKVTVENGTLIDKTFEGNYKLEKIKGLHNSILDRDGEKFKSAFDWCKGCCVGQSKRGKQIFFVF